MHVSRAECAGRAARTLVVDRAIYSGKKMKCREERKLKCTEIENG